MKVSDEQRPALVVDGNGTFELNRNGGIVDLVYDFLGGEGHSRAKLVFHPDVVVEGAERHSGTIRIREDDESVFLEDVLTLFAAAAAAPISPFADAAAGAAAPISPLAAAAAAGAAGKVFAAFTSKYPDYRLEWSIHYLFGPLHPRTTNVL